MKGIKILKASLEDSDILCDMFLRHITAHPEYISHGEMQMGVAHGTMTDDGLVAEVSPQARHYWMKYIKGNLSDEDSVVYKAVDDMRVVGFCVASIMQDGGEPFGMICDVLVDEICRGEGIGTALLGSALEWLRSRNISDIYLESGLNNHSSHTYFMRQGFVKVSEIYKLMP